MTIGLHLTGLGIRGGLPNTESLYGATVSIPASFDGVRRESIKSVLSLSNRPPTLIAIDKGRVEQIVTIKSAGERRKSQAFQWL
jgi:hypothetical protein